MVKFFQENVKTFPINARLQVISCIGRWRDRDRQWPSDHPAGRRQ